MGKRLTLLGCLLIIAMGVVFLNSGTISRLVWQAYPYFFPQHVCYARSGVDTGRGKECLTDGNQIYEENTAFFHFPIRDWAMYRGAIKACQKRCMNLEKCAYFVIRWPCELYSNYILASYPNTYTCYTVGSEPRKKIEADIVR